MTHSLSKWAVAALVCSTAAGAHAANLDVRLGVAKPVLTGDVDVNVTVTVTNNSRAPMRVNKAQLPDEVPGTNLFNVTRDGQPVEYLGPHVKRGPVTEADFIRIEPGASVSYSVELTAFYDMAKNGRYAIEYVGLAKQLSGGVGLPVQAMGGAAAAPNAVSETTYLWLEGRSEASAASRLQAQSLQVAPMASSISYTGNCSASQKNSLSSAVTAATNYSQAALTYLSGTPSGTTRYKTWFGAFSTSGWNTAKSHFAAATDAFKNKPLTLDCSCKKSYYAYVYPTQPYKIYVCNAFWSAPMTGTDSKGGTLVHEMTHFNVVAGTDDWAYGHSAAKSLALSSPTKALDNADSHEYFAENSPPLP